MFTIVLGLSSAEAYISYTMTYIIGLGATFGKKEKVTETRHFLGTAFG